MTDQQKLRVMVVDDDLRIHATLAMMLGNGGFEHISVLPQKLEEQLATYKPQAVLLDLSMPTLDGIAALGILRDQKYDGRVIVMSGSPGDVIETARRVGQSYGLRMAPALHKPFRTAELFAAVRSEDVAKPATGVESELSRAFAKGEIFFHYQPKFDLHTRDLAGFESLARWQHPTRGLVLPGDFLPQVMSGGLQGDLARLALKDAVAQLEAWHEKGFVPRLSINVALDTAIEPAFLLQLAGLTHAMSAPASALTLELLEAPVQIDLTKAAAELARVRLMGIGLSIDDFGTQSSSLARLQHLPANELKVDRSFVQNLLKFKRDQAIVRSVTSLARELGMSVVAEGIEDEATLKLLLEMGCTVGQGFFLGRPMPAAEALQVLQETGTHTAWRYA